MTGPARADGGAGSETPPRSHLSAPSLTSSRRQGRRLWSERRRRAVPAAAERTCQGGRASRLLHLSPPASLIVVLRPRDGRERLHPPRPASSPPTSPPASRLIDTPPSGRPRKFGSIQPRPQQPRRDERGRRWCEETEENKAEPHQRDKSRTLLQKAKVF